jgi:hypothetical protein
MPTILDDLRVQIGFEDVVGGIFTLNRSTLDGVDVLDGLGAAVFSGAYDTVTTDVSEGPKITIGRDSSLAVFESSRCTFTLEKPGSPDYYNPNAVAGQSPLAGLTPGFEPMRPVRVQVKTPGSSTWLAIWYGFIRRADWDSQDQRCRVDCEDLFLWLSRVRPTFTAADATAAGVTNAATAIGYLLTLAGWTNTAYRDLGDGSDLGTTLSLDTVTTPDKTALQLIADILEVDRGFFWVQGGVATYRPRSYKFERASLATLQSEMLRTGSSLDLDRIVNRQTVTATGGTPQVEDDFQSQARYGLSDGQAIDSDYLASDTEAGNLARFILQSTATPEPPISLEIDNDSETNLVRMMTWKVIDRLSAPISFLRFTFGGDASPASWPTSLFGGTSGFGGTNDYHVERIEQDFSVQGNYIRTRYTLSRRGAEVARFGFMEFGEADTTLESSAAFTY